MKATTGNKIDKIILKNTGKSSNSIPLNVVTNKNGTTEIETLIMTHDQIGYIEDINIIGNNNTVITPSHTPLEKTKVSDIKLKLTTGNSTAYIKSATGSINEIELNNDIKYLQFDFTKLLEVKKIKNSHNMIEFSTNKGSVSFFKINPSIDFKDKKIKLNGTIYLNEKFKEEWIKVGVAEDYKYFIEEDPYE